MLTQRQTGLLSTRPDRAECVRDQIVETLSLVPDRSAHGHELLHFVTSDPGTFYAVVNVMRALGELSRSVREERRVYYTLAPYVTEHWDLDRLKERA
jgi:hypothetical protein